MKKLGFSIALFVGVFSFSQNGIAVSENVSARVRVIVDNDFGGDPDGLFQLAHHVLSPSTEIRGIIGSHLKPGDPFYSSNITAENAVKNIHSLLKVMNKDGKFNVFQGSNTGLKDTKTPIRSAGALAIVEEAHRTDAKSPLYMFCGAGLTEIASALLLDPSIAEKITLVWIGGPEYLDLATPPPGFTPLEYNLGIDIKAAQVVFNHSEINIWQVPRNAYRQTLFSYAELLTKVKTQGETGKYLSEKIEALMQRVQKVNFNIGETYILGDSPLVLLTALQSSFEADPSSSNYVLKSAPTITDAGLYEYNPKGKMIRVYHQIDNRLMFEDFTSKLQLLNSK